MNICEKEIMKKKKEIGCYGHPYSLKMDRNWKSSAKKRK